MSARRPFIDIAPLLSARGAVALPGSKSISNRSLLLAALAQGKTTLLGLLASDDTARMLDALAALGVRVDRHGTTATVDGVEGNFPVKRAALFLGNAGTAFRPLTAVLALSGGDYELRGVERMHERPIGDLVDALRLLGARIDYLGNPGYPPLAIHSRDLAATDEIARTALADAVTRGGAADQVEVRGDVSSQFLTALLLAAPLTGRDMVVRVAGELISKPYVEITLNLMARFGVEVERDQWSTFRIGAGSRYSSAGSFTVEGDASSASYFLAAGVLGGGPVRVNGVGRSSIQGDVAFSASLQAMGATVTMGEDWIEAQGPINRCLHAIELDCNHIPDAAMTLAVLALFAQGTSVLRNIGSWRVKETDRIAAMATELAKLGADVEAGADYLRITPPAVWRAAALDTYDDHRMAMCGSLAAFGGVPVRINDPDCVAKTFPDYFEQFGALTTPLNA